MTIIKYKDAANTLQDIKSLHALWMRMRIFLDMSFTDEPLSADTEQNFLQVKSQLSKYLRVMAEKVDKTQFRYDPEKITNLLRQAISVTHLRGLPIPDRKTLFVTWHEVYVHLTQVMGAFSLICEGYQPKKKVKKDSSIAALKRGASDKKKKESSAGKIILIVVVIIVVVVGIIALNR